MPSKHTLADNWESTRLITNKKLIQAFLDTPRELFVPDQYLNQAYGDYPLPIPGDQTISQPTTVMIMIQALEPKPTDKVLEIGTGSGWNAAILSKLVKEVYTTEIVEELIPFAKSNLKKAKVTNVKVLKTDGSLGYKKAAPYDKIIVTAAAPKIVEPWVNQLKEGGIIVAPVGSPYSQRMVKARKINNKLEEEYLGDFVFVPLKGRLGF